MNNPEAIKETYVTAESLDTELSAWLNELKPYQWRITPPLQQKSAALLVVDMTRPFVDEGPLSSPNAQVIVSRIGGLVDSFRNAHAPVIWIVQGHHSVEHDRGDHLSDWWPTPILEKSSDVEMAAGLEPLPEEKVIMKRRYSGFYQTDLELTLRNLGITQVVVCGVLTHMCPFTTALDAFMRDFTVFYPADGTASINRELHTIALKTIAGWCGYVVRVEEITGKFK